jgi:hypothetical protein
VPLFLQQWLQQLQQLLGWLRQHDLLLLLLLLLLHCSFGQLQVAHRLVEDSLAEAQSHSCNETNKHKICSAQSGFPKPQAT